MSRDPRPELPLPAGLQPAARPEDPRSSHRRHAALAQLGRKSLDSTDLGTFLAEAGSLAAEALEADAFGAGELSADGQTLAFRFGTPLGTRGIVGAEEATELRIPLKDRSGLLGLALERGGPLAVGDLRTTEYRHEPWLSQQTYRGALVSPLGPAQHPVGALAVFTSKPRKFTEEDLLLAETIVSMASSTVARVRAEQALGEQGKWAERIIETGPALVLVLTPDGRIVRCNRSTQEVTGFNLDELQGRTLWGALLIPEEVSQVRGVIDRIRKGEHEIPCECYILTKQGNRRRVAWNFAALRGKDGKHEQVVGSGIDITEKCEALARLEIAQHRAEAARQMLHDLQSQLDACASRDLGDPARNEGAQSAFAELRAHLMERQRALDAMEEPRTGADEHLAEVEARLNELLADDANPPPSPSPTAKGADRRSMPRRPFPYLQVIAPVIDGRLPDRGMFREVRCHDISTGGFSYLSPVEPQHTEIVVAFGSPPRLVYLRTAIAHVSRVSYKNTEVFQVGCKYLDRVEIGTANSAGKSLAGV